MDTVPLSDTCLSSDLKYALLVNLPRREAEEEVRQLKGGGAKEQGGMRRRRGFNDL